MKRTLLIAILTMTVLGATMLTGTTAEARKPVSGSSTAGITLNQGAPHLGDWVTFTYNTGGNVSSPRIEVDCYQNGTMVFAAAGPASDAVLLGGAGSAWLTNGGPASCTATLYYWDFHPNQTLVPLASTNFNAN
jgi:hypothetical protein